LPGKHQPRRLNSYFGQRTNIMLRRPLESALPASVGWKALATLVLLAARDPSSRTEYAWLAAVPVQPRLPSVAVVRLAESA
jgi:hypothetical protein